MSRQSQLLQWRKMGHALSCGTPHRKRWLLKSCWCFICACGCSVPQRWTLCKFTLPLIWNVASSEKMCLSMKSVSSIFNCISSQKSCLFTLSAGVRACTNHILYSLKHSRLRNTLHTVIFGMTNSLLALATDLQGFCRNASRTLSMLSSDTRGRPGLLPLHKHPVSTNCRYYLVMLFLQGVSFLNRARNSRCTVITDLDTQNRAHRKPFPAVTPSWKLSQRPRSKNEKWTAGSAWETWAVATADGVSCAHVRWEINFLLTFETASFFCVYPVYDVSVATVSSLIK